jgi:UDP-N-acetylglucosamine:LPS N-acetylglucosamine transferase
MKFLIIPGNNSLSHGIKSLAIQNRLQSGGYECLVAVSPEREEFFKRLDSNYTLLGDIQESDGSAYPTMNWFRDPQKITECIEKEMMLMHEYKPDLVLGVFRFTSRASAFLSGLPFESLTCGCMLPDIPDALGFGGWSRDLSSQREFINMFFKSAANKMSKAMSNFGMDRVNDIREMLLGDRTYLWDIPEFMSVPERKNILHVGPLFWNEWMQSPADMKINSESTKPLAILAFGTCNGNTSILNRMIDILHGSGYKVIVAAGGQEKLVSLLKDVPGVTAYLYAPVDKILPYASLVVCHGGQMTIFEALAHEVPVLVLPFHPEQAHNGICLEHIGCGRMLVPACHFVGNSSVYTDRLDVIEDEKIKVIIADLVENPDTKKNLRNFKNILTRYNGLEKITGQLVQ